MATEYHRDRRYVEFEDVHCKAQTDLAILCEGVTEDDVWVPKSQVHDDSEVYKKDTDGTLIVSRWWADQKGLT
jgi:hypothetical protein